MSLIQPGLRSLRPTTSAPQPQPASRWRNPALQVRGLGLLEQLEQKRLYWPWDAIQAQGVQLPPLGLGTWAWGNVLLWDYNEANDAQLQQCFNKAVSRGVTLFDTADSYGTGRLNGRSEILLGQFLQASTERVQQRVKIATKLAAYPWRLSGGQMVSACRGSLKRLNLPKLAIGQLHWSAAKYAPFQEKALWEGLVAMYDQGLVEAVGVSNYGPRQLLRIHNFLRRMGVPLSTLQMQYSLISNGVTQQELKAVADDLGIKVIAYSPLGLGMLTGKYSASDVPRGPRGLLFRQILPGLDPLLRCLKEVAVKRGKSNSQVAVNWCMCKGTIPIPGAKNLLQVDDNLGALGWRLSSGEVAALDSAALKVSRGMIQNIFQTT